MCLESKRTSEAQRHRVVPRKLEAHVNTRIGQFSCAVIAKDGVEFRRSGKSPSKVTCRVLLMWQLSADAVVAGVTMFRRASSYMRKTVELHPVLRRRQTIAPDNDTKTKKRRGHFTEAFCDRTLVSMIHEKSLGRAKAGTGSAVDFTGTWVNELKSEVTINQVGAVLSGTYESAVSAGSASTVGDLQGYVDGDLISFVVHWRDFQAVTAWVGQLEPQASTKRINTLWQMTKQVAAGEEWASINAGADYFTLKTS